MYQMLSKFMKIQILVEKWKMDSALEEFFFTTNYNVLYEKKRFYREL